VGLKPTYGLVSTDGVFPLAPTFDHAGPMAMSVDGCASLLGLDVPVVDGVRVASAWGGVHGTPIEFPTAEAVVPAFMREVGDVHRDLYAENVERCIAVTDAEYAAAVRARDELRERAEGALDGFDVLVTPVLSCPVPPVDCEEIEVRAAMTL